MTLLGGKTVYRLKQKIAKKICLISTYALLTAAVTIFLCSQLCDFSSDNVPEQIFLNSLIVLYKKRKFSEMIESHSSIILA